MTDLAALQETLGVLFHDLSLLEQALVHSSYLNEKPKAAPVCNERLEFLGDAILNFIVAEKLYRDFPSLTEGRMTKRRSVLVRRDTLADIARVMKLGDYLYLGKGEEVSGGRDKSANLAGALEAVFGAVFLDQGFAIAREVVLKLLGDEFRKVTSPDTEIDYKSRLQELIQSQHQAPPIYRLVEAVGPDHEKKFTAEVLMGETVLGRGSGRSKKMAETEAARAALARLATNFTQ